MRDRLNNKKTNTGRYKKSFDKFRVKVLMNNMTQLEFSTTTPNRRFSYRVLRDPFRALRSNPCRAHCKGKIIGYSQGY